MSRDSYQILLTEFANALEPLRAISRNPVEARVFIRRLGWELPFGVDGFGLDALDVRPLINAVATALATDAEEDFTASLAAYAEVAARATEIIEAITTLATAIPGLPGVADEYIQTTGIVGDLPKRAIDYLLVRYIEESRPIVSAVLQLFGIVKAEFYPAVPATFQSEHVRHVIDTSALSTLLSTPEMLPEALYQWGTDSPALGLLFRRLAQLIQALGAEVAVYKVRRKFEEQMLGRPVLTTEEPMPEVRIMLFHAGVADEINVGLSLFGLRATAAGATDAGIGLTPFARGATELAFSLARGWQIELDSTFDVQGGVAILLRPGGSAMLHADLLSEQTTLAASGRLLTRLVREAPRDQRFALFSVFQVGLLEVQRFFIGAGAGLSSQNQIESLIEGGLEGVRFIFNPTSSDPFISTILPPEGFELAFDLNFGWSSVDGFYFTGGAALELTIPIHESFGPIKLESFLLRLRTNNGAIGLDLGASFSALLGPITAIVQRIGATAQLTFPADRSGNLSLINLDPSFLPPAGLGLAIDADPLVGGGYLEFDQENERYAGMLQLAVGDIGITAIGLITTRMPDGSKGFSMLGILAIEFDPPFSLSYNFYLSAVGGLFGLNRTFDVEEIQTRFWDGALDSIMFPHDPVANASSIISDLRAIFPPKLNHFLIAPMVAITWSYPPILRGELGILVEFATDPLDLIGITIFGQLSAILPDLDNPIVKLQLDAIGGIYLQRQELMIDANLFDSSLLSFNLEGGMALRLRWGNNPYFAMSVGGFHPDVTKPPDFPSLKRMSLNLVQDSVTFSLTCYFGITPNTVQFGANVEATLRAGDYRLYGNLGFDTLFQFSPFSFSAHFYAEISLTGPLLDMSVFLDALLEGPTPWHIRGVARVQLFLIDVSVDVDVYFGQPQHQPLPTLDPTDDVLIALRSDGSWQRRGAGGASGHLIFGKDHKPSSLPEDPEDPNPMYELLLTPTDRVILRQNILPFEKQVSRFGNAVLLPPATYDIFVPDQSLTVQDLFGHFAPGQFQNLTMDQKLSARDFELCKDGIQISNEVIDFDEDTNISLVPGYDEKQLHKESGMIVELEEPVSQSITPNWAAKRHFVRSMSRSRSARGSRFGEPTAELAVKMPELVTTAHTPQGGAQHGRRFE